MKLMRIFLLFFVCQFSVIMCESEDKIVEAIEASDPDALRGLIIPGFLIRLEDKKRYVALAHSVTNRTHAELQKFSLSDVARSAKGLFYLGLGGTFGLLGGEFFTGWKADIPLPGQGTIKIELVPNEGAPKQVVGDANAHKKFLIGKQSIVGTFGALGVYFTGKSLGLFHDVLTKKSRLTTHNNALTVEAIILRLPAFDNGCFIPGSSS